MGQKTKYDELISLALRKYTPRLTKQDKEDIRQECKFALFKESQHYKAGLPDRLAYKVVERTVIDWLRRSPPRMENIDDPDILRAYNKQTVHFPDLDRRLDGEAAMWMLYKLPQPYKKVLSLLFNDGYTESQIALICKRSQFWVNTIKCEALQRLKEMMGE